jgi:hypothetical protein
VKKDPGRQLTPAEMRRINDAFASLKEIIKTAKREHAAKRKEARKCTSKSAPSKSPERVAA